MCFFIPLTFIFSVTYLNMGREKICFYMVSDLCILIASISGFFQFEMESFHYCFVLMYEIEELSTTVFILFQLSQFFLILRQRTF